MKRRLIVVGMFMIVTGGLFGVSVATAACNVTVGTPAAGAAVRGTVPVTWTAGGCTPTDTVKVDVKQGSTTTTLATVSIGAGSTSWNTLELVGASRKFPDAGGYQVIVTSTTSGANDKHTGIIVDNTNPTITLTSRLPAANPDGWNNGTVTVTWGCTDGGSGVVASSVSNTVSSEGAAQSSTGTCTDNAGNTASNTVTDINIDLTAPSVSVSSRLPAANSFGWNNADVSVSWDCTDALSGVDTSPSASTISTEGAAQTASGTCTDNAGNSATDTVGDISIDKTAPEIGAGSRSPEANGAGWNNTDVTASWSCTDALSGAVASPVETTVSSEGAAQTATGVCSDEAGNTASADVTGISIDKTAPGVTSSRSPEANTYGWNNTDVTIDWACADSLSGPVAATLSETVATEGENQSRTATCTDNAGNSTPDTVAGVSIDKTAPGVTLASRLPAANTNGWNNGPVTATFSCTDALSGPVAATVSNTVPSEGAAQTASADCTDEAGNSAKGSEGDINIDTTDPAIAVVSRLPAANTNGWNNAPVSATWGCSDTLSGAASATVSDTSSSEGAGQSLTGTCFDLAGNDATDTVDEINIDLTAPTVAGTPDRSDDANGWFNHAFTVDWSGTDALSGVDACSGDAGYGGSDTAEGTLHGTCTDNAGNTSPVGSFSFSYDATAPSVTGTPDRAPNAAGWYNAAVTVSWSGTDALSGGVACSPAETYNGPDDAAASVTGSCTDGAGNVGSGSHPLKYDATAASTGIIEPGPIVVGALEPLTGTADDATSGVASTQVTFVDAFGNATTLEADCAGCGSTHAVWSVSVASLAPGLYTVTATSDDLAGNPGAPSASLTIVIIGTGVPELPSAPTSATARPSAPVSAPALPVARPALPEGL